MKKRKRRFKKILIPTIPLACIIILLFVFVMSYGFASYSSSLSVTDFNAYVRYDDNVRITGVSAGGSSGGGTVVSTDYSISSFVADVRMNQADSSVTFSVDVRNYGNVEMGIASIILPQYQNIFDVSVSNYTLGDKIRDNADTCEASPDGCTLNIYRTFEVTLTYKSGAYDSNHYFYENLVFDFEFVEMYKVTFTGFTFLQPTLQARSAMGGHTYSYNIGPYDTITVKMGGVVTSNYSVDSNNVISIPNVSGDIEIIITEIMIPVDITISPASAQSGDTVKYVLNGGNEVTISGNGIHINVPYGSSLTINSITSYGYKTKTNINYNNISSSINDTITMDQVFYLDVVSNVSGTTFNYTINGVAQSSVQDHLSGEFDPGTVIVVTASKANYRPAQATYTYTMNSNYINQTINMIRQYTYRVSAVTPGTQTFMISVNNGTSYAINAGENYIFDAGTKLVLTASASGYRTKTITHNNMTSDITDSVSLTKTYIYTVNAMTPSNATLALTVNGVSRGNVASGYSEEVDVNSEIVLTASASGYETKTINHTGNNKITSDTTDNVTLRRVYNVTLTMDSPATAKKIVLDNGDEYTNCSTINFSVVEGSGFSFMAEADYYLIYQANYSAIYSDTTIGISMPPKPEKTAINPSSYTGLGNALSGSTYSKNVTINLSDCSGSCKITYIKISGNIDNGTANVENGTFSVSTNSGTTLLSKNFSSKSRGKRDVSGSKSWSLANAPVASSLTMHFEKSGWLAITTPNVTFDSVKYVNK